MDKVASWFADTVVSPIQDRAGIVIKEAFDTICFAIDYVVYSFIPRLYNLFISLANVDLYRNNTAISALMSRVYILVGIFMLFKLSFSIISYIVDPNAFSDQSKGFTNLIRRVMIAIVLLVSVPWLFGMVYDVQRYVLDNNVISNLILGTSDTSTDTFGEAAKDMQFLIFGPFFTINPVGELSSCKPDNPDRPLSNVIGTTDMALKDDCLDKFAKAMDEDDSVIASGVTIDQFFKSGNNEEDLRSFGNFGALLHMKVNNSTGGTEFAINYMPIASTICAGYLVFLLLSFCIDIAARAIRLMFLQILSPVAIITSIDPTTSSQNDRLKEWGKECLTTFLSLFLRLSVIYLAIQMVRIITTKSYASSTLYYEKYAGSTSGAMNIFVYVFLVLGVFQVAKKIPELLEKAFGIKMSGELNLNPFKALNENAGVGALIGAGVGAGATALSSGATAIANGSGLGGTIKSTLTGFGVGAVRGGRGGFGKNMSDAIKAGTHSGGVAARNMLMRREQGISFIKPFHPIMSTKKTVAMGLDNFLDRSGGPDLYQMRHAKVQRLNNFVENAKKLKNTVEEKASTSKASYSGTTYRDYLRNIQAQEWRLEEQVREGTFNGDYSAAKAHLDDLRDKAYQSYINESQGTKGFDYDVDAALKDTQSSRSLLEADLGKDAESERIKRADPTDLGSLKDAQNAASNISKSIQSDDSYRDSMMRHETRANVNQERFYETSGK